MDFHCSCSCSCCDNEPLCLIYQMKPVTNRFNDSALSSATFSKYSHQQLTSNFTLTQRMIGNNMKCSCLFSVQSELLNHLLNCSFNFNSTGEKHRWLPEILLIHSCFGLLHHLQFQH